jgi:hypothetical protein
MDELSNHLTKICMIELEIIKQLIILELTTYLQEQLKISNDKPMYLVELNEKLEVKMVLFIELFDRHLKIDEFE